MTTSEKRCDARDCAKPAEFVVCAPTGHERRVCAEHAIPHQEEERRQSSLNVVRRLPGRPITRAHVLASAGMLRALAIEDCSVRAPPSPSGEPGKHWKDYAVYQKRFGGVWYRILIDSASVWSDSVFVIPSRAPRSVWDLDAQARETANARITRHVKVAGKTWGDVEREVAELVGQFRAVVGPRRTRDLTNVTWRPRWYGREEGESTEELRGAAALARWKLDVERVMQKEIDATDAGRWANSTSSLVLNVLNNYGLELFSLSRRVQARMIRSILDSMARRGKIVKCDGGREVEWIRKEGQ